MATRKPSIEVYLTEEQKVEIKKASAEARLSISEYCIQMIFKGVINAPLSPQETKLMVSLSGMANNLNQAMKRVNQDPHSKILREELHFIIGEISKLLK